MKFKGAGIMAVLSVVVLSPYVWANEYLDMLKSYVGKGGAQSQSQDVVKSNLNTREAQLEAQVQAGVRSGQLTAEEERDLQANLDQIVSQQGVYLSDGKLENWEIQGVLENLSAFSRRLDGYLTNSTTANPATSQTFSRKWYDGYRKEGRSDEPASNQAQLRANVDTRHAQLDSAVESGVASGAIGWSDANRLKAELQSISNNEQQYTTDGRLSFREANDLISQLDAVDTKIKAFQSNYDRNRRGSYGRDRDHHRDGDRHGYGNQQSDQIDANQSMLMQRIRAAMQSGQLTKNESDRLLRDEQRIADLEAQMRAGGGRLGYQEQKQLLGELEQLSRKVSKELNDHQVRDH